MKQVLFIMFLLVSLCSNAQRKIYPYRIRDKFGYSDENKKILIEPAYYQAWPFYDGLARVAVLDAANKIYYGFINEKGKWIIPATYFYASDAEDGKIIIRARTGYGVIDKKGKVIIDTMQRSVYYNSKEKVFKAEGAGRNYCFFDKDGKQLFPYNFSWLGEASEGLAPARDATTNQYGYINMKGEWVIGPKKEYVSTKPFSEGIAAVTLTSTPAKGNDIYIDKNGTQVINAYYSNAGPFKNGIASVDYTGYINKKGEKLFTRFNSTSDFRGGLSTARNTELAGSSTYYLIDTDGKELASVLYTGGGFQFVDEGNILKQSLYKYGVIDRKGKTVIECKYDRLRITRNGYIYTYFQDKNYNDIITGYISETGVEFWEN